MISVPTCRAIALAAAATFLRPPPSAAGHNWARAHYSKLLKKGKKKYVTKNREAATAG